MSARLANKVAVVTGGGQGIGRATVEAFSREGATVIVADNNRQTGSATAEHLTRLGRLARFIELDVRDSTRSENLIREVVSEFGRVDVLVANAGINIFSDPLLLSEEDWRRCFAVDLDGVWFSVRAVLPQMLKQERGSVIVMASCHSSQVIPNCFPYPVAKHGVLGLVRALGVQYAGHGIRVNAIAPGYIETELAEQYWASFPNPEEERTKVSRLHPAGRIGRAEEVAMTAVFLASDEAPFINATSIQIDGGRSAVYHD